jgi:hypothetical protein
MKEKSQGCFVNFFLVNTFFILERMAVLKVLFVWIFPLFHMVGKTHLMKASRSAKGREDRL